MHQSCVSWELLEAFNRIIMVNMYEWNSTSWSWKMIPIHLCSSMWSWKQDGFWLNLLTIIEVSFFQGTVLGRGWAGDSPLQKIIGAVKYFHATVRPSPVGLTESYAQKLGLSNKFLEYHDRSAHSQIWLFLLSFFSLHVKSYSSWLMYIYSSNRIKVKYISWF